MLTMQKDLLAELHLPKLNLKSLENIVAQNSRRLACVLKDSDEFIKNNKSIPPDLKVVMGSRLSEIDVDFPPVENVEIIKREFIKKETSAPTEISAENDGEKSPDVALKNNATATYNSAKDSDPEDNIKCVDIQPLLESESPSTSTVSVEVGPTAASLETCSAGSSEPSKPGVAYNLSDEDSRVQILSDKSSYNCLNLNQTSGRSLLKHSIKNGPPIAESLAKENTVPSTSNDISEFQTTTTTENEVTESWSPAMCVISEVIGNAHTTFAEAEDSQESLPEAQESQIITPQKTNDITKIKGWRRKQFFVEKPTTIEFYSMAKGHRILKKKIELRDFLELSDEPGNKENAFVCDSLDEFLDQEADLKIGCEVPHLYAELGIKLTSDDILSRPNFSEKYLEEVETRYCVPIALPFDNTNLDDIKVEIEEADVKGIKRPIEEDVKPCKVMRIDGCRRLQTENLKIESPINLLTSENRAGVHKAECRLSGTHKDFSNIKLVTKLIALVVYPGPFKPLHPVVQYHLQKLRSYRTAVDENWANFAASAVVVNDTRCERRILPAYCCVRVQESKIDTNEQIVKTKQNKVSKEKIKLKECHIVIKRLKPSLITDPWCMDHNCYNCSQCGLDRMKTRSRTQIHPVQRVQKILRKREEEEEDQAETVTVSPRASFNKKIARLLAKKVRLLKANGNTLTGIDSLKATKSDTIEFIKLKFVKESFLSDYINIWYLKPESAEVRSRAFLTFSRSPPVPNAINLKSTNLSLNNLPKVITEMVSAENAFDSNEYAILHCIGGIWEIHGSLNITFGSSDKSVEQIFSSLELPELSGLQEVAKKILRVKAVKWWVLDLTQRFKLIEIRTGHYSTVVPRKKFLELIKANSFGFIALRKDHEYRVLGAYIMQRLLPFVLIGPYYLLETKDLILKGSSSTVPFRYYGEENVTTNYPLKFFINSVIKNVEKKKHRKLEGLWLYDKICLDKTSYIEVVMSDVDNKEPCKVSIIDIEHGYSLNSLTNSSPSGATSGIVRRKDGKDELQTVTVYLYFDIFQLGYLEGELQFDNSVIINHPLDERTKMKSHKIGDWFLSIIRRRVIFIPENLAVRWFVTKYKEDIRDRRPFNKFILGGAHIITKSGVYYLLDLSESKIKLLGLDEKEITKIMTQCEVLKEVRELKNLAKLLMNDSSTNLSMEGVLTKAVKEIKNLENVQKEMNSEKTSLEIKKLTMGQHFLRLVNSLDVRSQHKIKMIENMENLFTKVNGRLHESFVKGLRQTSIGIMYLRQMEKRKNNVYSFDRKKVKLTNGIRDLMKPDSSKPQGVEFLVPSVQKLLKKYPGLKKVSFRPLNTSSNAIAVTNDPSSHTQSGAGKTQPVSEKVIRIVKPKIIKIPSPVKESSLVRRVEGEKVKNAVLRNNLRDKRDGFRSLSSTELPNNIKLCWRNWNVKKLEVT